MTTLRQVAIFGVVMALSGLSFVTPAWADEAGTQTTDLCSRYDSAWEPRQASYERAREIRKKAFEKTKRRWEGLFAKLDAKNKSTGVVRVDADDVSNKFGALISADDTLIASIKNYGKASCSKAGVNEARKGLKNAQDGRREVRQAFVKALRQLATDLLKLKTNSK